MFLAFLLKPTLIEDNFLLGETQTTNLSKEPRVPNNLYVHVVILHGRAVISFPTYSDAREWVSKRPNSTLFTIDYVPLMR